MRLIDADALMQEFAEFVRDSNNSDYADVPTWNDAVSLLGSAPTIEERKKGKWMVSYLEHEAMGIRPKLLYCSECCQCTAYPANYCPECGADMRGEGNGRVYRMGGPDPDRGEADQPGNGPHARPEQDRQLREKNEEKVMLREISPEEAFRLAWDGGNILAVDMEDPQLSDWMWFNPRLRSCRFLIEEETKEEPEEPEEDQDPEDVLLKEPPKRRRRSPAEIEEAVLKAWNRGERSITQIMELSGCSYKQVRKYIPEIKEG